MNSTHSERINKEDFFKFIELNKKQQEGLSTLNNIGFQIWESDIIEYGNIMFDALINSVFTEEGVDWIYWWLYELPLLDGHEPKATDEYGNPIPVDTIEDLWNIIKEHIKS